MVHEYMRLKKKPFNKTISTILHQSLIHTLLCKVNNVVILCMYTPPNSGSISLISTVRPLVLSEEAISSSSDGAAPSRSVCRCAIHMLPEAAGGGWGAVAPQKLLASGNRGDREDWLGHGVTPTISIIFRCHSDYVFTHITGGIQKSCTVPTSLNAGCLRSETGSDS